MGIYQVGSDVSGIRRTSLPTSIWTDSTFVVLIVPAVFTSSRAARLIWSLHEICILIAGISSGNKRDGLISLFRE